MAWPVIHSLHDEGRSAGNFLIRRFYEDSRRGIAQLRQGIVNGRLQTCSFSRVRFLEQSKIEQRVGPEAIQLHREGIDGALGTDATPAG
jgi:hypothetical protein